MSRLPTHDELVETVALTIFAFPLLLAFLFPQTAPYVASFLGVVVVGAFLALVWAQIRLEGTLKAANPMALSADDVEEEWD